MDKPAPSPPSTYTQIFRASALLGGSHAIVYATQIARAKIVAHLLGPTGVGTLGIYQSILVFVSTVASLGIPSSGVRQISQAGQAGDGIALPRVSETLKRLGLWSGLLGTVLLIAFALPFARFTLGDSTQWAALAILSCSNFFSSLASARLAIIQGCRRTADLARCQTFTALTASVVSVLLFLWLGHEGIVPSLILSAGISFLISKWYVRRLKIPQIALSWKDTVVEGKALLAMGVAFMWNGAMSSAVAMVMRALVVRELGLAQNGIFQAAWALSVMFAAFLLSAMGLDFYPRLSAVAEDRARMNQLVNEQTEIGIILALPGLLVTIAVAPWILVVFYSRDFAAGGELLPWLILGVFLQIVSWPLGFMQMAKGQARTYMATQTIFNIVHLFFVVWLMNLMALRGVGIALPLVYLIYTLGMLVYCRCNNSFRWSRGVIRLLLLSFLLIALSFAVGMIPSTMVAIPLRLGIGLLASVISLRELMVRLPDGHKLRKALARFLPGGNVVT